MRRGEQEQGWWRWYRLKWGAGPEKGGGVPLDFILRCPGGFWFSAAHVGCTWGSASGRTFLTDSEVGNEKPPGQGAELVRTRPTCTISRQTSSAALRSLFTPASKVFYSKDRKDSAEMAERAATNTGAWVAQRIKKRQAGFARIRL